MPCSTSKLVSGVGEGEGGGRGRREGEAHVKGVERIGSCGQGGTAVPHFKVAVVGGCQLRYILQVAAGCGTSCGWLPFIMRDKHDRRIPRMLIISARFKNQQTLFYTIIFIFPLSLTSPPPTPPTHYYQSLQQRPHNCKRGAYLPSRLGMLT
jgi:hypothetical protein